MAKNSEQEQNENPWQAKLIRQPNHDISINGKEAIGLAEYLQQLAFKHSLNWWELAHVLLWHAIEQVAAADHQTGDIEGINNFSISFGGLYQIHRKAMANQASIIINPTDADSIN